LNLIVESTFDKIKNSDEQKKRTFIWTKKNTMKKKKKFEKE